MSERHLMSLNLTTGDIVDYGVLVPDWLPGDVEIRDGTVRGGRLFIPLYKPFGTPSGQVIAAIVWGSTARFYHVPMQVALLGDGSVLVLNRTLGDSSIVSLVDPASGAVYWTMHIPRALGSLYTFPLNTSVLMWVSPDGKGFMLLDPENDSIVLVPIPSPTMPEPGSVNGNPALIYRAGRDVYAVELIDVTTDGRASIRVYHAVLPEDVAYTGAMAVAPSTVYIVATTREGGQEIYRITFGGGP